MKKSPFRHAKVRTRRGDARVIARWPAVWWLLGLMCVATLAPGISRAVAHGRPLHERGWVQVCSAAHGALWVQAVPTAGDAAPADGLLHLLDACGHCVLASDRSAPPPVVSGWAPLGPLPEACPAGPTVHWAYGQARVRCARGPPVST